MSDAGEWFFRQVGPNEFVPTSASRGPYSADSCHGGPPTGLLARACEQEIGDKQLVRLSVEFHRPVPMSALTTRCVGARNGRTTARTRVELHDERGEVCSVATGLHVALTDLGEIPTAPMAAPDPTEMTPGPFPIPENAHGLDYFPNAVEVAYPSGQDAEPGPTTIWMWTVPLLDSETPSAFQRLCPLADCGNGFSRNASIVDVTFVNVDLTITMFRAPTSDWLASSAISHWQQSGIGLAHADLFDETGPVASAQQTLLLSRNNL